MPILKPDTVNVKHQLVGGQLLELMLGNQQLFYLSPLAVPTATARGGIPVCFPQFGELGSLPKHGFARHATWRCVSEELNALLYELIIEQNEIPTWPFQAKLTLQFNWSEAHVTIKWRVANTGEHAFTFTGGLHPYFRVQNLLETRVEGLKDCELKDRYKPGRMVFEQEVLTFDEHTFECSFTNTPDLKVLDLHGHGLHLSSEGFSHWMIWNPGQVGAATLPDLPAADWKKFVCIEPVVLTPINLASQACFEGIFTIKKV